MNNLIELDNSSEHMCIELESKIIKDRKNLNIDIIKNPEKYGCSTIRAFGVPITLNTEYTKFPFELLPRKFFKYWRVELNNTMEIIISDVLLFPFDKEHRDKYLDECISLSNIYKTGLIVESTNPWRGQTYAIPNDLIRGYLSFMKE